MNINIDNMIFVINFLNKVSKAQSRKIEKLKIGTVKPADIGMYSYDIPVYGFLYGDNIFFEVLTYNSFFDIITYSIDSCNKYEYNIKMSLRRIHSNEE